MPDCILIYFFKELKNELGKPLVYIFNLSVNCNEYPLLLKEAKITPILKSGQENEISNYKPI